MTGRPVFNNGVGGQYSTEILARIIADTLRPRMGFVGHELDEHEDQGPTVLSILWIGRNGRDDIWRSLRDIKTATGILRSRGSRVLVLSVLNGAKERRGTAGYDSIMALNRALALTFRKSYLDIRGYLVEQYDPTKPGDVADHSADVPPGSLRVDELHPSIEGNRRVAQAIAGRLRETGW